MFKFGAEINRGWKHHFANFNENNSIDYDEKEGAKS
jgi:hypothetical protein